MNIRDAVKNLKMYFQLSQKLEALGGREAVVNQPSQLLEKLYDEIYDLENVILSGYELPPTYSYRSILFNFSNQNANIEETIEKLKSEAQTFLTSTPKGETQIVIDGLVENLDCSDVFPEVGIEDHIYTRFVFEEVLPKCSDDQTKVTELIKALKDVSDVNLAILGEYHLSSDMRPTLRGLLPKSIPFLKEYFQYVEQSLPGPDGNQMT